MMTHSPHDPKREQRQLLVTAAVERVNGVPLFQLHFWIKIKDKPNIMSLLTQYFASELLVPGEGSSVPAQAQLNSWPVVIQRFSSRRWSKLWFGRADQESSDVEKLRPLGCLLHMNDVCSTWMWMLEVPSKTAFTIICDVLILRYR